MHIKKLFGVGNVQKTADVGVFRYSVGSFKSNRITIDYFLTYPLKGKKQSAFLKWKSIHEMLLAKKHLQDGGFDLIKDMAKSINDS